MNCFICWRAGGLLFHLRGAGGGDRARALASGPGLGGVCTGSTREGCRGWRSACYSQDLSGAPADPFRWLEDGDAPAVARWTEAQKPDPEGAGPTSGARGAGGTARTSLCHRVARRAGLPAALPGHGRRKPGQPAGTSLLLHAPRRRTEPGGALCARRPPRRRCPLVDVNRERADGTRALDWWFPSDDGARVAYGTLRRRQRGVAASGARRRERTGRGDQIPRTRTCSLAWTSRRQRLFLHALSEARARCRPARRVSPRRLLPPPRRDPARGLKSSATVAIAPTGPASISRPTVAGWWSASPRGGPRARCTSSTGTPPPPPAPSATDRRGRRRRRTVRRRRSARRSHLSLTTSGAPRGRIFAVDPKEPARAHWREVVPEGEDVSSAPSISTVASPSASCTTPPRDCGWSISAGPRSPARRTPPG